MIKEDNLFLGDEARVKMMSGIKKVSNAVGITMGTSGKNSLIEAEQRPGFLITNDGFYIANSIRLADSLETMGQKQLIEAINRANKSSGDGSSTTCVLTSSILEEGAKHLDEASPMEIKRSLEACIPIIEASILKNKKDITVDNLAPVVSISAEDEEIGNRIQEIYQKIGPKGVIQWDLSKTPEDSYSLGEGLTVHGATYVSRYMCELTDQGFTTQVRLKNPKILLAHKKITSMNDLDGLSQTLFKQDIKELAVFCDDISPDVVNGLIQARQQVGFRVVVIKMPILWADQWWEDLSEATGAKVIDAASGIKLRNVTPQYLGTVEHLNVDKEDAQIDGIKDLTTYLLALKVDGSDEALQRAERLNTKTARYFVGAHSESALAYRRLKVEDAISAASCALDNGVVAGGGVALLRAVFDLSQKTVGEKILGVALQKPIRQIVSNTGNEFPQLQYDNISLSSMGFDSKTGKVVDMFETGIVDPTDVVLNAVKAAIGVAASILTVGTVVTLPKEEQK